MSSKRIRNTAIIAVAVVIFLVVLPTAYMTFAGSRQDYRMTVTDGKASFAWKGDFANTTSTSSPVILNRTGISSTFQEGNHETSNLTVLFTGTGFNSSPGITLIINVTVTGTLYGSSLPSNLTFNVSGGNYSRFQSNFAEFLVQKGSVSDPLKLSFPQTGSTGALPVAPLSYSTSFRHNSSLKVSGPIHFTLEGLLYVVVNTNSLSPFNINILSTLNGLGKPVECNYTLLISQN